MKCTLSYVLQGISDVNETLSGLNDELVLESRRTTEVLAELELLKEELEDMLHDVSLTDQVGKAI